MTRILIAITLAIAMCSMQHSETLLEKVCRFLKIDAKIYKKLTSVRGVPHSGMGQRLMIADLGHKRTWELWKCSGCWSPIVLDNNHLAVAKSDGIWVVSQDGQATLVIRADNIGRLIGVIPGESQSVLALTVEGAGAEARYLPIVADLAHGMLKSAPTELAQPFRETELIYFPRRDCFRVFQQPDGSRLGKFLSSSATRPTFLLVAILPQGENAHLSPNTDLLPWLAGRQTKERFDPIWLGDQQVVFLEAL